MSVGCLCRGIAAAMALFAVTAAVASTDEDPQAELTAAAADGRGSGWLFGGGLAVSDPAYVGFNRQLTPVPLIFYHNGRFFFAGVTAGYVVAGDRAVRLSLIVKPRFNRLKASDSPQLVGIQTREWSIDGGASLDVTESWGHLNLSAVHDLLDRYNGTEMNTGYQYPLPLGSWTLSPGLGLRWNSGNFTNYYYGVSPAEAIPGRPAYSPGSAVSPYVSLDLSTAISEHWRFRGRIQYERFGKAITDSPIVARSGSPTIFIGFVYNPNDGQD